MGLLLSCWVQRWDRKRILDDPGTASPFQVEVDGTNYYYMFSDWRVPADLKSLADLSRYEVLTCLQGDGRWFTKAAEKGALTPRYDYNQMMYRLALDDPRLTLPMAVYRVTGTNGLVSLLLRDKVESSGAWERVQNVGWFALTPTVCPKVRLWCMEPRKVLPTSA